MKPAAIRFLLVVAMGCCAASAQNSDFALMLGGFPSVNGTVGNGYVTDSVSAGVQFNYATQVHAFRPVGDLYLEVPLVLAVASSSAVGPGVTSSDHVNVYFTPGVRLKFTHQRLSFYPAVGAGFASFGSFQTVIGSGGVSISNKGTTTGALAVAGAMEFRASRLLGLRLEYRDTFTRAGLGGASGHGHSLISLGLVFHF